MTPDNSERMFSSGNERTPAFMAKWAGAEGAALKPVGYHVKPSDKFAMIVDLMNDSGKDKGMFPRTLQLLRENICTDG